jgi:hypothetical protein
MRGLFIVFVAAAGPASACGYCIEDMIAATYDHAVLTRAFALKHHVVFFHVEGTAPGRKALEEAVYSAPGVDRGTVRVSADLLTLSFAYDPERGGLGAIHSRIEKRLAPQRLSLMPFQVIEQPADLKAIKPGR